MNRELLYVIGGLITVLVLMFTLSIFLEFVTNYAYSINTSLPTPDRVIAGTSVKP